MEIKQAIFHPSLLRVKANFGLNEYNSRIEWLKTVRGEWFVVEEQGEVVGWVIVTWAGKATHPEYPDLSDLYVREDKRGQGIGTALLQHLEALARQKGYTQLGLAASHDPHDPARQLYHRLGYDHDGRSSYVDGVYDGVEDWVIDLEKALPTDID